MIRLLKLVNTQTVKKLSDLVNVSEDCSEDPMKVITISWKPSTLVHPAQCGNKASMGHKLCILPKYSSLLNLPRSLDRIKSLCSNLHSGINPQDAICCCNVSPCYILSVGHLTKPYLFSLGRCSNRV